MLTLPVAIAVMALVVTLFPSLVRPRWATPEGVAYPAGMDDYHRKVTNRLKTARGHLDGIIRMVEDDAWCPDIMKQLAAVQGMLEGTSREVFRHHLESHVADAIRAGRGDEIVDELMETLKYDKRVLRPSPADVDPHPADETAT